MPPLVQDRAERAWRFDAVTGANIRRMRTDAGMTLEQLAEIADMDITQLSRTENGERSLSFQQGLAIARHFRVRPRELAEGAY